MNDFKGWALTTTQGDPGPTYRLKYQHPESSPAIPDFATLAYDEASQTWDLQFSPQALGRFPGLEEASGTVRGAPAGGTARGAIRPARDQCDWALFGTANWKQLPGGGWETHDYWLVGAAHGPGHNIDMTEEYIQKGIWENGYEDRYLDLVRSVQVGDLIAIKTAFVVGKTTSVMDIKAVGVVTGNPGDGRNLQVDWERMEPRRWYHSTYRSTITKITPDQTSKGWKKRHLTRFIFGGWEQDVERFKRERNAGEEPEVDDSAWIPFYEACADALLDFRDRREELLAGIRAIASEQSEESHLRFFLDGQQTDMCPFTTMGLLTRGNTDEERKAVAAAIAGLLDVTTPVPEHREEWWPLLHPHTYFSNYENDWDRDDYDALWDAFAKGIALAEDEGDEEARAAFAASYDRAQQCSNVASGLSMALFWVAPNTFPSLGKATQRYIRQQLGVQVGSPDGERYLRLMDDLKEAFAREDCPVHSIPEMVRAAFYAEETTMPNDASDWAFHEAIADALLPHREDRTALVGAFHRIAEEAGWTPATDDKEGTKPLEDLDPFSTLGLFNRHSQSPNSNAQRRSVAIKLAEFLGVSEQAPEEERFEMPSLPPINARFFSHADKRGERDIDRLWDMFAAALDLAEQESPESRQRFVQCYDAALEQRQVSWNLATGLYWMRPLRFLPLPENTREYLREAFGIRLGSTPPSGKEYLELLDDLQERFAQEGAPARSFPEVARAAYGAGGGEDAPDDEEREGDWRFFEAIGDAVLQQRDDRTLLVETFHHINEVERLTPATDILADGSTPLLEDIDPFTALSIFNRYYGSNEAQRREIRRRLAIYLAEALGVPEPAPDASYFDMAEVAHRRHVDYWFINTKDKRGEQEIDTLWDMLGKALALAEEDSEENRRLFVERFNIAQARRPVNWRLTLALSWVRPRHFLALTDYTKPYIEREFGIPEQRGLLTGQQYLELLDRLRELFADEESPVHSFPELEAAAREYRRERDAARKSRGVEPYSIDRILEDGCFLPRERLEELLGQLRSKKNLILQGPPGTGKTWLAKRLAYALMGAKNPNRMRAVQFHPNLSYEDFVRGWRPAGDGKLELVDGPFLEVVNEALGDIGNDYAVVVEEINRGNPAQIFGEMLTLLEADKRQPDEALELSYRREQGERVHIPPNLHLIGTMNIADRSLAMMDLALRRRFAFADLVPVFDATWRNWVRDKRGMDEGVLATIGQRMTDLNNEIAGDASLGEQFRIGHSFFTPREPPEDVAAWYRGVVDNEIVPLLTEYWLDNPDKVGEERGKLSAPL